MSDRPFFEKGYVDEGGKVSNTATTNGRTTGDIRAPEKQQPKIGQILSHSDQDFETRITQALQIFQGINDSNEEKIKINQTNIAKIEEIIEKNNHNTQRTVDTINELQKKIEIIETDIVAIRNYMNKVGGSHKKMSKIYTHIIIYLSAFAIMSIVMFSIVFTSLMHVGERFETMKGQLAGMERRLESRTATTPPTPPPVIVQRPSDRPPSVIERALDPFNLRGIR